jgi:hypothetical protein
MHIFDDILKEDSALKNFNLCIIRLTTSYWHDKGGCHVKKTLRFLKRRCEGCNILYEDCSAIGASEAMDRIINLYDCKDGVYKVDLCNEFSAWETPNILEDYDYKLVPYELK